MSDPIHSVLAEDVRPLTELLRNHRAVIERLRRTGRPELLTVHGKAAVVIQDAQAYERLLERAERMDTLIAVREGLEAIKGGEGLSLDEFERRLRARFPLPDSPDATGTEGR